MGGEAVPLNYIPIAVFAVIAWVRAGVGWLGGLVGAPQSAVSGQTPAV